MSDADQAGEPDDGNVSWAWDFAHTLERANNRGELKVIGASALVLQRAADDSQPGTTLFVASTDSPDRAMDVVRQDWRLKNFRANPVIFDNHNPTRVVGSAVTATVPKVGDDAGKLMIRVGWDQDSPDPTIRNVGHQHLSGHRRAGSVGFKSGKKTKRDKLPPDSPWYQQPIEVETWWGGTMMMAGTVFEQNELLEFSSASIPMNAEALQRSLTADADPTVERAARARLAAEDLAELLRADDPDPTLDAALDAWLLRKLRTSETVRRIVLAYDLAPPGTTPAAAPTRSFASLVLAHLESK